IGSNDRETVDVFAQRQEVVIIFKQAHRLSRHLERQIQMSSGTANLGFERLIHQRMFEQAEHKLRAQNTADGGVERSGGYLPGFHAVDDRVLKSGVVKVVKLHVQTGVD